MQRALSYAAMPALRVPRPFMPAAPCFALAAALLLVWHGEAALVLRWTPVTLCMTHLVVLGFLTMTIVGALFQLLPVTAGVALALGTAVLAAALGLGLGASAFRLAAGLLGSAGFVFLSAIGAAVARPVPAGAKPLVEGVLVIVGCAMSAVNGMLYKIVPFLVWYHLAHDASLPRERIPRMSAVLGEAQAARQWRWHLAGLVLLYVRLRGA